MIITFPNIEGFDIVHIIWCPGMSLYLKLIDPGLAGLAARKKIK